MTEQDDRRSEIRVPLPIQLWFNNLENSARYVREQVKAPLGMEFGDLDPELEGNDDLERFLLRLDEKLTFIISLLTDNMGRKDFRHTGQVVDVSESGLKMISPFTMERNAYLEIGLTLPHMPYRTMDVLGQVVWLGGDLPDERGDDESIVGVKFIDILARDQDEIVHWIFQQQREEIRRRKESEFDDED